MALYKYLERRYQEDFASGRRIRIGTLEEFRREESLGTEIGDNGEGIRQVYSDDKSILSDDPSTIPPIVGRFIEGFENTRRGVIFDCKFEQQETGPNVYILCLSEVYDSDLASRMKKDACVEIADPPRFIDRLTDRLFRRGLITGGLHQAACVYGERRIDSWNEGSVAPWSMKPTRYSYQREYRVAWEPTPGLNVEPVYVRCLSLRSSLRQVDLGVEVGRPAGVGET